MIMPRRGTDLISWTGVELFAFGLVLMLAHLLVRIPLGKHVEAAALVLMLSGVGIQALWLRTRRKIQAKVTERFQGVI
jgi:hypothetical protein